MRVCVCVCVLCVCVCWAGMCARLQHSRLLARPRQALAVRMLASNQRTRSSSLIEYGRFFTTTVQLGGPKSRSGTSTLRAWMRMRM